MATLIANLGTSDLSIKIPDFDLFLPIGFDRNEHNIKTNETQFAQAGHDITLTAEQQEFWVHRGDYVSESICKELEVRHKPIHRGKSPYDFRELTEKLWAAYDAHPTAWDNRLCPSRILGIIKASHERFNVDKVYLYVSNQVPSHGQDTVYLFKVLQKWFERVHPQIQIFDLEIPSQINLSKDQDALFDHYYDTLIELVNQLEISNQPLLMSIKGGTPPMQSALKVQGLALDHPKLLFIDPQLARKDLLTGKPSPCQLTSYWRSAKAQKYRTVELMLETWDFWAAAKILKEWNKTLTFLTQNLSKNQEPLRIDQELLSRVIKILEYSGDCFNLDVRAVQKKLHEQNQVKFPILFKEQVQDYSVLLNLYAQCQILWKLQRYPDFLTRFGSFGEAVFNQVVWILIGKQSRNQHYFLNGNIASWQIRPYQLKKSWPSTIWYPFQRAQSQFKSTQDLVNPSTVNNPQATVFFSNRLAKQAFIDALLKADGTAEQQAAWDTIKHDYEKLEIWVKRRNDLIHGAEGLNKERFYEVYQTLSIQGEQLCQPHEILQSMAAILNSPLNLISPAHQRQFVAQNANSDPSYYLFSAARDWVKEQLTDKIISQS